MESKGLYKLMRIPSLADALAKRSQNIIAERQEKRREFFWGSRVGLEHSSPVEKKKHTRAEMLKKWKAEKMKRLEEEKKKQKPIFKVGIVQRKITGSPVITQSKTYLKKTQISTQQNCRKPQTNQRKDQVVERTQILTRAKARNMGIKVKDAETKPVAKVQRGLNSKFYKIEAGKKKQIDSHVFKVPETVSKLPCPSLTYPYSPKFLKKNEIAEKFEVNQTKAELENKKTGTKAKVVNLWECSKENIEEESIPNQNNEQPQLVTPEKKVIVEDEYRPIVYSPFVTIRSGKKGKKRSKKSLSIDVEEQIKKEESEFKCRIFSFRKYLDCEGKRLLEMCEKWKHIYQEFEEVPEEVEGDIDSIVGKTNLLTSDKFGQFKGLIDKCENGDPFVKIDDLQGFQDWVSIEVERIDEEFIRLEKLKCNGWKSETVPVEVTKKVKKVKQSKNSARKPAGTSNIRSHILAARKLLKERNANGGEESVVPELAFEPATPKKSGSLLKDVLNSEAKKKGDSASKKSPGVKQRRNSGLEIMMATQKNKYPTPVKLQKRSPVLTDYEIFVGSEETPSRSILKKTPKTSNSNSSKGHVMFKHSESGGQGLSEKYFQPLIDSDSSPMRTVLGDLGNVTPSGMMTRSRKRQISFTPFPSPQVN